MILPQKYWDELAFRYPRYNDSSILKDANFIFENAKQFGIDMENKNILDIGCGTGTLALNIAHQASQIDALDSSAKMLKVFKEDAKILNLDKKIDIFESTWEGFLIQKNYDIAIASMTPAINTDFLKQKFVNSAKSKIYVGWGEHKHNDVLDVLFDKFQIDNQKAFGQTKRFCSFLKNLGIDHEVIYFESSWTDFHSKDEALKYCQNHLERFNVSADKNFLNSFLDDFSTNNQIKMTTNAQKGLVLFKN